MPPPSPFWRPAVRRAPPGSAPNPPPPPRCASSARACCAPPGSTIWRRRAALRRQNGRPGHPARRGTGPRRRIAVRAPAPDEEPPPRLSRRSPSKRRPRHSGSPCSRCPTGPTWFAMRRPASLDPFMVAALIRQESEFNPQAVSRAKAYGLTQVMPSTGRQLARKLGVRTFKPPHAVPARCQPQAGHLLHALPAGHVGRALGSRRWRPTTPGPAAPASGSPGITTRSRPSSSRPSRSRRPASTCRPCCATPKCIAAFTQERPVEMAEEPPVKPAPPARPAARKSRQKHG